MQATYAQQRTARVVEALRSGVRPTMAENIACIGSIAELEAFRSEYLARRGPLPTDVLRALVTRRQEIEAGKP